MRLGFLLDDEYTEKILELADFQGIEPYEFLLGAIDAMVKVLRDA